jgi:NAD(P)-dependent dehydrogenase (short-subunit alcohol dehydrogenase family)
MYKKNYGRIVLTSSGSGVWGNFGQSNYGAAKMGMLGLMNVLAIEGAAHNVRVNCRAPGAATRMIATIPGQDNFDPDNPPAERAPSLVTPAVLFMCTEDAPSGKVFQAGGGNFSVAAMYSNEGVSLGAGATFEDFMANKEAILDMSGAQEGRTARRQAT